MNQIKTFRRRRGGGIPVDIRLHFSAATPPIGNEAVPNMRAFVAITLSCLISSGVGFQQTSVVNRIVHNGQKFYPVKSLKSDFTAVRQQQQNTLSHSLLVHVPSKISSTATSDEEWTKKRMFNKNWFRSASILLAILLTGATQKSPLSLIPSKAGAAIHLLSFATWFGTVFYTTFIAGLTMFKNLPRQTFGKLQSKLFPKYFSLCSITILFQILTLRSLPVQMTPAISGSLGVALSMTLLNQFFVEPYSTTIMMERYELENSGDTDNDEYRKLKAEFGKFHGISSLTNLIAFIAAAVHGIHLSSLLL